MDRATMGPVNERGTACFVFIADNVDEDDGTREACVGPSRGFPLHKSRR